MVRFMASIAVPWATLSPRHSRFEGRRLLRQVVVVCRQQVFAEASLLHGVVHGDPHGGNVYAARVKGEQAGAG